MDLNPRSDQLQGSTRNGERDSPSLWLPGNYSSARGPCPSTAFNPPGLGVLGFHHRDMSPPVYPPGVYDFGREPGPSVIHHRDVSPQNPPGVSSSSSQPSDLSLSGMFQAFRSEMQEVRNVLDQLVQSRESLITPRRIRREHGNYKVNQSQRPRTDARNDLMVR